MFDWFLTLAGLVVGAIGLWLPGHFLQRAITCGRDGAVSLVISVWLLFTVTLGVQVMGAPITLWTVAPVLAVVGGAAAYFARRVGVQGAEGEQIGHAHADESMAPAPVGFAGTMWMYAGGLVCVGVFIGALAVSPLNFYDYPIRWDLFPKVLLERGNLGWYPVMQQEAYADYLYPDAIPQAVGVGVWWLYAWAGTTAPWVSGAFALAQYVALGWVAGRLAGALGAGERGRVFAMVAVMACPLVVRSLALRQEAGLLALSCVVCVWALVEGKRERPHPSPPPEGEGARGWVVIAGLAAAAAMCTREYGGFILLPGTAAALWMCGRRAGALFAGVALCAGLPWFLYVWVLTGNPFYSIAVPGVFVSGAPVWTTVMTGVQGATRGLFYAPEFVGFHLKVLAVNVLPAGLLALMALAGIRRWPALVVWFLLWGGLWHWASLSSAGGYEFALRVMAPGLVLGLVLGVAWLDGRGAFKGGRAGAAWGAVAAVLIAHAGLCVVVDRFYFEHPPAQWPLLARQGLGNDQAMGEAVVFGLAVKEYPEKFKGARVLTTNPYIAAHNRGKGVGFVPPWSPEVAFLYEPGLTAAEKRRRLLEAGIGFAILEPRDLFYLEAFGRAGFLGGETEGWSVPLKLGGGAGLAVIPRD
jgi:hypothetical protein